GRHPPDDVHEPPAHRVPVAGFPGWSKRPNRVDERPAFPEVLEEPRQRDAAAL
ncbi:MAG: hypothetical protein AVDCRST_MAG53-2967, partial [uncultured Solirubrobacteraceae bacterium]